ncbi:MAG: alpha/beta hydrolase [Tissierellia bacterium]|nr:alpha/beta hydrolase [Tissierellia bacterium]
MEITIDNKRINYIDQGEGEVFLVLHGWGASIATVMPIVNALASLGRVVALDLPGFGDSEEPEKPYESIDYTNILWDFMEKLNIDKVNLLGHSFGGKLSILLATQRPSRINKIMLIDSAGIKPKRKLKYYAKVYLFKTLKQIYKLAFFWGNVEKRMEKFYSKHGSTDYKNAQGVMRQTLVKVVNEDLTPLLKDIVAPTLLFWGSKDEDTPLYMAKIMEEAIGDVGLVVAEGAGHYAYLDQYGFFVNVLKAFFK